MAAFFADVLEHFVQPSFLERVEKKFHYGRSQMDELFSVVTDMLPLLLEEAFWERRPSRTLYESSVKAGEAYEDVVMSLGKSIDRLQEDYSGRGKLLESYMLEGLASELLLEAYGAYNRYIKAHTDRHVARYHFPGSEVSFRLDMLPKLLKGLTDQVSCNSAFCLMPKKSVVFIAELTKDERIHCQSICTDCSNANCPNRVREDTRSLHLTGGLADMPLSYGYSRILKGAGVIAGFRQNYDDNSG